MTEATIPERERPDHAIARDEMRELLDSLGVTVTCEFVPLSKSRNAREKHPTVNWRATVRKARHGGGSSPVTVSDVLTCDYSQGVAHLQGYDSLVKRGEWRTISGEAAVFAACEGAPIVPQYRFIATAAPTREDVLSSLAMDSDAIDHATYESWASDLGYGADSRKGEAIYRACLETALKLRAAFGDEKLRELRELANRF